MFRRFLVFLFVFCLVGVGGLFGKKVVSFQIPKKTREKVERNVVSVVVYYTMGEEEYNKRMEKYRRAGKGTVFWKDSVKSKLYPGLVKSQIVVPVQTDQKRNGQPVKMLAYIGSGTALKNGYVLTVKHLFDHDENSYTMTPWVYTHGLKKRGSPATVIALSKGEKFWDDYAVIRSIKDLGMDGLKVARPGSVEKFDLILHSGSVGGFHCFTRPSFITEFHRFFIRGESNDLKLGYFAVFPFWATYPGGPGDSGGAGITLSEEIFTVFYCGVDVFSEQYIFGNPTQMLWDFLRENKLTKIAR